MTVPADAFRQPVDRRVRRLVVELMGMDPAHVIPGEGIALGPEWLDSDAAPGLFCLVTPQRHNRRGYTWERWGTSLQSGRFVAARKLLRRSAFDVQFILNAGARRNQPARGAAMDAALRFALRCESEHGIEVADLLDIRVRARQVLDVSAIVQDGWEERASLELMVLWDQLDSAESTWIDEAPRIVRLDVDAR